MSGRGCDVCPCNINLNIMLVSRTEYLNMRERDGSILYLYIISKCFGLCVCGRYSFQFPKTQFDLWHVNPSVPRNLS